ncbi:GNAT family N-acetyltransferase [Streptosporangium minutum]|uniref:GNAT family N-acetyltransferase n=1 Tax=Streptosporangium minutum TaxID=569862 RepID=A0A243RKP1_9ACTN|nr:GNAT family N-acetyltransferase [Streptosporangium minutum]OUC95437.1 GNAT family N-acetyltransferase [Streptosporangium minutum]
MTTHDTDRPAFAGDIHLTGLGLVLREWDDHDVPAMAELFDEPAVDRWTPLRAPFDLAAARAYLGQARQRRADGERLQLAVTTDGHRPLGEILLFPTGTAGEVELAYAIGAAHRRQGLARRAVQLITGYAYDPLAAARVLLRISPGNTASAAVARSAGFQLTSAPLLSRAGARDPLHTWLHHRTEQFTAV